MGTLSWVLLLLAANGALLAALLGAARGNRVANRLLATLVALISLRLAIYVLGFAGAYDVHPWLTFAPFDASLAFGPLLWLYVRALTRGGLARGWWRHLLRAVLQLAYSMAAFALPLDAKLDWYRGPHLGLVEPVGFGSLLCSATVYLIATWRRQRDYQRWLDDRFADRERWRLGWMTAIVVAFAAMLALGVAAALIDGLVTPLDYFARTPVVIASSLLAYALGLLGWHHAGLDLPMQAEAAEADISAAAASTRAEMAFAAWARRIEAGEWWREEGITLAEIARRLAISERSLSRGLREGGGCSFNGFVNGLRVAAVMRAMAGGSRADLLTIAFDCGFNSKASFNRAFLRHTGMTPSRWRAEALQNPPILQAGAM